MLRQLFNPSFLLIFLLVSFGNAQQIINNSNKPTSRNAGRTMLLEEILRIEDDGETTVFRVPKYLTQLTDGSLLFLDFPFLYKYGKDGQFIFKTLKPGLGPGECEYPNYFIVQGDRIRVTSWAPAKVLDFNLDGEFIEEISSENMQGLYFLNNIDGDIYGIRSVVRDSGDMLKEGIIESPFRLYKISHDFHNWTKVYDFPIKHSVKNRRWIRLDMFDAISYKGYLFVVNSAEYKIVRFDLNNSHIDKVISREYIRQKIRQDVEDETAREVKRLNMPRSEYFFDIFGINIFNESIWVITSTRTEDKTSYLVDTFSMEGIYTDSFYLQIPKNNTEPYWGWASFSDDGHIYLPEQSQDTGLVSIGKYRLKDIN